MLTEQRKGRAARLAAALLAAAAIGVAACAEGGRTEYGEVDTPQAAPGTVRDASTAERVGVDTGATQRTGAPAVAGDTVGARGQPAGVPDTAVRTDTGPVRPPR